MVSDYSQYAWIVPLFPLAAFLLLTAFGRQLREGGVFVGIVAAFASFALSLLIFFRACRRADGGLYVERPAMD